MFVRFSFLGIMNEHKTIIDAAMTADDNEDDLLNVSSETNATPGGSDIAQANSDQTVNKKSTIVTKPNLDAAKKATATSTSGTKQIDSI